MSKITTVNPYDDSIINEYEIYSDEKAENIINDCNKSFDIWRKSDLEERKNIIKKVKEELLDKKEDHANLISEEMGKPITEAGEEVEKCTKLCDYYIENAEGFLKDHVIENDSETKAYVSFQPLGVILAVMPWNFPYWQVFRFAIPTIMAGNTALLKHASNVSGCSLAIEKIFEQASENKNLFRSLIIKSSQVEKIIENKAVKAVTLTGSVPAGRAVAEAAGRNLKKSVLELGGNDPYIILKNADVNSAVRSCVKSKMINGGQSCIAAKRFIVEEDIYDEFTEKLKEAMEKISPDKPKDKNTRLGPMVSIEARNELHEQVLDAIRNGAKCLLGGEIPEGKGALYPTTILTEITKDNPIFDEELFGPVAVIYKVKSEEEAIKLANDSSFGLGSAIFGNDKEKAEELARNEVYSGCCFVNDFAKSDPKLPFGGVKDSGFGRELGEFGIREFVNVKTIVVK